MTAPVDERRAAFLPVQIAATTEDLSDHLGNCRDLTELIYRAAGDLPKGFREPLQHGLGMLMDKLGAALTAIEAEGAEADGVQDASQ